MLASILLVALGAALGAAVVVALWLRARQGLVRDLARMQAERDAATRAVEEQRAALAHNQLQLREAFSALSRSALKENSEDFMATAASVMNPVRDTLERVRTYLSDVDKAREGSFQAVATQLGLLQQAQEQLRSTTEGLSRSLGSPNVRGAWGEIQLRRIVELSGMLSQCDFVEKESAMADSGARQLPDLIVKLPGHAAIVVDSKAPIDAYRSAVSATDPATRDQYLALHARQVRDHMKALGAKEYWKQFQPAPDFVVMFLPLEPLLPAAFERDPGLFDLAASLRVIPATPMTLLALLKAVASGWRQHELAQNTEEIRERGRELFDRLSTMVEHLESVGKNIKQAAESYNRFVGSLEQKVLPSARRFKELGVSSTKTIEEPSPIDVVLRPITKEELTGRPVDIDLDEELPVFRPS